MHTVYDLLRKTAIIPVIKIQDPDTAVPLAKALQQGGISAAEITFRTEGAEESIRRIAREMPEICLCAGTILTPEQAERAVDAGAKAIISPGTNLDTVQWCLRRSIPVIPGCATPTEVETCMRAGLTLVKLFPAQVVGGVSMLKALYGPYPAMRFMPTGGINLSNVMEYLSLPNVWCCGGTWLTPEEALMQRDFEAVYRLAKKAREICAAENL